MSETHKLLLIPDVLRNIGLLRRRLEEAGIELHLDSDSKTAIPKYSVKIPDDTHVIFMGDWLSYSTDTNVPRDAIYSLNRRMMGIMSAIAVHANATVLIGTNELDAMGLAPRHDMDKIDVEDKVAKRLVQMCADGFINHAAVIDAYDDAILPKNPDVYDRRRGFTLDVDFLVTHAGLTWGLWQEIGQPLHGYEVAEILNNDLLQAAREQLLVLEGSRSRINLPTSLRPSNWVSRSDFKSTASPTSAHAEELHNSWAHKAMHGLRPRFGQLRAHSSIEVSKGGARTLKGVNLHSIEPFKIGNSLYPGIVALLHPIISVFDGDRSTTSPDSAILIDGVLQSPISTRSRLQNGERRKLRTPEHIPPFAPTREGAEIIRAIGLRSAQGR